MISATSSSERQLSERKKKKIAHIGRSRTQLQKELTSADGRTGIHFRPLFHTLLKKAILARLKGLDTQHGELLHEVTHAHLLGHPPEKGQP